MCARVRDWRGIDHLLLTDPVLPALAEPHAASPWFIIFSYFLTVSGHPSFSLHESDITNDEQVPTQAQTDYMRLRLVLEFPKKLPTAEPEKAHAMHCFMPCTV